MAEIKVFVKQIYRRVRSLGIFQKLGYAQVRIQSKLFPPPPKGKFPPVWLSAHKPHGLVAIGGSMTAKSLQCAYVNGIYPKYDSAPIEWFSSNPRMILYFENMKLKKGLRPLIKSGRYTVTFDSAFETVVKCCSERKWTWLVPERIQAAVDLYSCEQAHSVEVWNAQGELVGGMFGVEIGRIFISESAFHKENNTMKVAFAHLNCHLQQWGYAINDVQLPAEHFRRLGYEEISRRKYMQLIQEFGSYYRPAAKWHVDENIDVGSWIPSKPGSQLKATQVDS